MVSALVEKRQQQARRGDALLRVDRAPRSIGLEITAQRGDRLRSIAGAEPEGRGEVRQRSARSLEVVLLDVAEPHQQLELRDLVGRERELGGEHGHERIPIAARLFDPSERPHRAHVARCRSERLLVGRGGAVEIDELLFLQRRGLDQQLRPRRRLSLACSAPAIRREQLGPVGDVSRELFELGFRLAVVGGQLEHFAVVAARALRIAEPASRDLRELAGQLELELGRQLLRQRALERSRRSRATARARSRAAGRPCRAAAFVGSSSNARTVH